MPGTIVVPLDGSRFAERALAPAAEVARRSGARVVVLSARYGGVVVEPRHYLEEAARAAGIVDPVLVVIDDRLAASAIVSVVAEIPDPVVCMTTHARQAVGQALFGSVAEETLRRVDAPALLVGPSMLEGPVSFEEIVVCVDGSVAATAIVPVAAAWARDLKLDITVVGVVEPGPESELAASVEAVARDLEAGSPRVRRQILHAAHAADGVVEFVRERPRAFVALATHGRTGLARLTAGSVTMAVVHSAPCAVLTVRPPGLV
ncbi:MAG: universal stress protein [Acidimicrobiia bacterium]